MRLVFVVFVLVLLAPGSARAAVACSVTAQPVNFPVYLPFVTAPTRSTGSVTVTCDGSATYTISFNRGLHFSSPNRQMANGGVFLTYQLFTDSALTQLWGDGTGGTKTVTCSTSPPTCPASQTVYGKIQAKQTNATAGDYIDTVNLIVTY